MFDLGETLSVAFSGSDLGRALWMTVIASLLVGKRVRPWKAALIVLLIDRAWPYASMLGDYEPAVVLASLSAAAKTMPEGLLILGLRYCAMLGLIALLWRLRLMVHGKREARSVTV